MINWPPDLINAVARRRSVILIGSGVSANAATEDGKHPRTWATFLDDCYKNLPTKPRHIKSALNRHAYLEACDYLKKEFGAEWNNLIKDEFSAPYKHASIHENILNLDSRIVASLNFDRIYDNFAIKQTEGTVIIKNYYDVDIRESVCGQDRYILKPHGSIDAASKVIFTLTDYGKARTEYSTFYEILNSLIHTHTFLCVGCGLSDPDMQIIFEDYRYRHNEAPHYITLPKPISSEQKELIRITRGMNVLQYSPKENHKELSDSIFDLAQKADLKRTEIADEQSW